MSTEIAERGALDALTEQQVDLITRTVAKGASKDELALFLHQCKRTGLDPLSNQIYWIKRGNEGRPQISIGGARLIAERSGKYRPGYTYWYDEDGVEHHVWLKDTPPAAARVTIYKDGQEVPGRPVTYKERVQQTPTWKSMPATMLAKCAEMDTLRTAFPQELSGLYSPDEMGNNHPPDPQRRTIKAVGGGSPTQEQLEEIADLVAGMISRGETTDEKAKEALKIRYQTDRIEDLTRFQAEDLLKRLKGEDE